MKINPKNLRAVTEATQTLRKTLVEQTIELMKLIGAEKCQPVTFDTTLILYQREKNGLMKTIIADRVSYDQNLETKYLIIEMDGNDFNSSLTLSLSNLQVIYNEIYKVVKRH